MCRDDAPLRRPLARLLMPMPLPPDGVAVQAMYRRRSRRCRHVALMRRYAA